MRVLELVRRNRAAMSSSAGTSNHLRFSAAGVARVDAAERLLAHYACGRVLDVGCGHMPFKGSALRYGESYEGLDVEERVEGVKFITDIHEMCGVPRSAFDTILCFEVLEHVADPERALKAIREVMAVGATLLLSVPHLSRLHELPHDYFRFTEHGLRVLLDRAGFDVLEITPHGGPCSFVSHQLSTLLLGLTWSIPVIRSVSAAVNRLFLINFPLWLDSLIDPQHFAPVGYSLAAKRSR